MLSLVNCFAWANRPTIYSQIDGHHITQLLQDDKGFLWVATWDGLYSFDGYDFVRYSVSPGDGSALPSDRFRNIRCAPNDNIYCLVDTIVVLFNTQNHTFESLDTSAADSIRNVFTSTPGQTRMMDAEKLGLDPALGRVRTLRDKNNTLWYIASESLYSLAGSLLTAGQIEYGWPVRSMSFYDDKLSVGHMKGLSIADKNVEEFNGVAVYKLLPTNDGGLWIASKNGGIWYKKSTKNRPKKISCEKTYDINAVSDGTLLVATAGRGLMYMTDDNKLQSVGGYPKSGAEMVRSLTIMKDTVIASTTNGIVAGVFSRGELKNCIFHKRNANKESSLVANSTMYVVPCGGEIVVCTESHGLDIVSRADILSADAKFKHISVEDGLPTDITVACVPIASNLIVVSKQIVFSIKRNELRTNRVHARPLLEGDFSDCRPIIDNTSDEILFGTGTGIARLPFAWIVKKDSTIAPLPLYITQLQTSDEWQTTSVDTLKEIVVYPHGRTLSLSMTSLDLAMSNKIKYAFRLQQEGEKSGMHWMDISGHTLTLTDMRPGRYTLSLRSTDRFGCWTDNVKNISINVVPQFSETSLARVLILIGLALLAAIVIGVVLYIRRIKHKHDKLLSAYLTLVGDKKATNKPKTTEEKEVDKALQDETMRRLMSYIDANIGNPDIRLADMASAAAVSVSGLNRKTSVMLGMTPAELLKQARLKKATDMLRNSSLQINDIAFSCGFTDPKYFSKCFKAKTGYSPTEYRERE